MSSLSSIFYPWLQGTFGTACLKHPFTKPSRICPWKNAIPKITQLKIAARLTMRLKITLYLTFGQVLDQRQLYANALVQQLTSNIMTRMQSQRIDQLNLDINNVQ
jgi:hypothetical protein